MPAAQIFARQGNTGGNVKDLQIVLNYLVAPVPGAKPLVVDGVFGPKTLARVVQFQQQQKLSADGIVGPITGKALVAAVFLKLAR